MWLPWAWSSVTGCLAALGAQLSPTRHLHSLSSLSFTNTGSGTTYDNPEVTGQATIVPEQSSVVLCVISAGSFLVIGRRKIRSLAV